MLNTCILHNECYTAKILAQFQSHLASNYNISPSNLHAFPQSGRHTDSVPFREKSIRRGAKKRFEFLVPVHQLYLDWIVRHPNFDHTTDVIKTNLEEKG